MIVIVADPEAPWAAARASVQALVPLPQPFDTDRSLFGISVVLLLWAVTVSGAVPVTPKLPGEKAPAPAVYSWLAPELIVSVGAAGVVTVTIIVAGAARLAPSSAETVTLATPT